VASVTVNKGTDTESSQPEELIDRIFERALELRRSGHFHEARSCLDAIENQAESLPAYCLIRGDVYRQLGLLEEALRSFRRAAKMMPRSETASRGVLGLLVQMGSHAEAQKEINRFLAIKNAEDYSEILESIIQIEKIEQGEAEE
jgi:tetratricopeptide (TPR) repeat protein